jgi:uncharacterized protein (DUF983 family)
LRQLAAAAHRWFEIGACTGISWAMSEIERSSRQAMWRGVQSLCPACGQGHLYKSYIKVADSCDQCSEDLHHQRADDAPPYFTIFIVAHIVIPAMVIVERVWKPELWLHMAIWLPLTLVLTLVLLPAVKGAVVGLQWALRMHGFGTQASETTGSGSA